MGVQPAEGTLNLERAVGTTDCADDTDKQGLGSGSPPIFKVSVRPESKPSFQARPSVESVKSVVKSTAAFRVNWSCSCRHEPMRNAERQKPFPGHSSFTRKLYRSTRCWIAAFGHRLFTTAAPVGKRSDNFNSRVNVA